MKAVRYTGRREQFADRLYGTNLVWEPNQVRTLPPHLADKFLRHPDVFELAKGSVTKRGNDDSAEILEITRKEDAQREQAQQAILAMYLEVRAMDKEALASFAQRNYGQLIDRRHSVEDLRQEVVQMIDRFGVV
jgi:hypothetical protein